MDLFLGSMTLALGQSILSALKRRTLGGITRQESQSSQKAKPSYTFMLQQLFLLLILILIQSSMKQQSQLPHK